MLIANYAKSFKDFSSDIDSSDSKAFLSAFAMNAGDGEEGSWRKNGIKLKEVLKKAEVDEDTFVAFEVQCPHGGRIDCMLFGTDKEGKKHIAHIEMKQWSNETVTAVPDTNMQQNQVNAMVGQGAFSNHAHPSDQALGYHQHLLSNMPIFEESVSLHGYAFCYGYNRNAQQNVLFADQYRDILDVCPLYAHDTMEDFATELKQYFSGNGPGSAVYYDDFINGEIRPTRMLMDAVADMFQENEDGSASIVDKYGTVGGFTLLGDQRTAANELYDLVIEANEHPDKKYALIVKGGPGTGKTLIALNVLSRLAKDRDKLGIKNIQYATRSRALRVTLKEKLRTVNADDLINDYIFRIYPKGNKQIPGKNGGYQENELDVLIVDEAHRIGNSSSNADKEGTNTYLSQINSLLYCAKITVFFIDDCQAVSSKEIGLSDDIKAAAEAYCFDTFEKDRENFKKARNKEFCKKNKLKMVYEDVIKPRKSFSKVICKDLPTQFRCENSGNYLDWLDHMLYSANKASTPALQLGENYQFGVFDTPMALRDKIDELNKPYFPTGIEKPDWVTKENVIVAKSETDQVVARLVAGYCWEWHEKKGKNSAMEYETVVIENRESRHLKKQKFPGECDQDDLPHDVIIQNKDENWAWNMPWETKSGAAKGEYKRYYAPSSDLWASEPAGIHQLGCVPSAQGFEFDYVGVIIGPDLFYKDGKIQTTQGKSITHSVDGKKADNLIRNIYRVLMTRGRKGCYVYCCDKALSEFFKNEIKKGKEAEKAKNL